MAQNGASADGVDHSNPLAGNPKYQTVRELGAGSFGIVQLAINRHAPALICRLSRKRLRITKRQLAQRSHVASAPPGPLELSDSQGSLPPPPYHPAHKAQIDQPPGPKHQCLLFDNTLQRSQVGVVTSAGVHQQSACPIWCMYAISTCVHVAGKQASRSLLNSSLVVQTKSQSTWSASCGRTAVSVTLMWFSSKKSSSRSPTWQL